MSSATKPRKLALLDGDAPCPTRAMIGPWLTGSSPGSELLNGAPGFGVERRDASVSEPRQEVFAVATRSWKSFSFPSHGEVAPTVGPGALMKWRTAIGNRSPLVLTRACPVMRLEPRPIARPKV